MSIFDKRVAFKPFEYPEVLKYKDAINHSYWLHSEWNFLSDIHDFHTKLTSIERNAIKNALLAISQIEISVKKFWTKLGDRFPKAEFEFVGVTFGESEVRHSLGYSHLLQDIKEKRDELRTQIQQKRDELRGDMQNMMQQNKDARVELRGEIKDDRTDFRADVKAKLDAATTPEERKAILEQTKEDREAMREDIHDKREALREDNKNRRQGVLADIRSSVLQGAELILTRLEAGIDRYTQLSDRIGARIDDLKAKGATTADAEAALATANAKIALAVTAVANGHTAVDAAAGADDQAAHKEAVQTALDAAKQAVRDAAEALRAAIHAVKSIEVTVQADATVQ
jgi:hypothetical protein